MESDGGGLGISPVDPEIKSALRKAISHFERAYGIQAQKVTYLIQN